MTRELTTVREKPPTTHPPYGVRKHIKEIKEAVAVEDYATLFTPLRRAGARLEGCCPLPDHEDRTPSFNVYRETNSWWCFGCSRGGDVLDLYEAVEGASEVVEAVVGLSLRFGVELSGRPERWHRQQDKKAMIREGITRIRADLWQRKLFGFFAVDLSLIEEPAEREQEARKVWEAVGKLAHRIARFEGNQ